jgi:hypothetical protein
MTRVAKAVRLDYSIALDQVAATVQLFCAGFLEKYME